MSTMAADITASVETIDLTGDDATEPTRGFLRDHAAEPKHQSFPRDGEGKDEPEIDLNDFGDDETDDGDDYIREITPNEFLKRTLEEYTPSATIEWTGQYGTEADITESGVIVRPGLCVELKNQEFLLIKKLFRRENNVIYLKGVLFIRTRSVMNMLPKKPNEVCAIVKARADTKSKMPDIDAYLVTRRLSDVICQRTLILTNQPFPIHSFREKNVSYPSWNAVDDNAELVCRYKHVEFCDKMTWKVPSEALVRLRRHECDIGVPDAQLMLAFRRTKQHKKTQATPTTETRTKLAATKAGNKRTIADVTTGGGESEEVTSKVQQTYKRIKPSGVYERQTTSLITEHFTPLHNGRQRNAEAQLKFSSSSIETASLYVYGDICAGAGGATTAAQRAGFIVKFALDHAADPCATLRLNFPNATIREEDIYNFCNRKSKDAHVRVDVLHISFPCQPYSIAHTQEGKNDETNEAAGYSVIPLLQKCRPRIVTFEQSPNITKPKHRHSFEALIHQVTDIGYSVRWKVVNFADTGNAQSRNRLFIIASCPGEPLPAFPVPTHGRAPGLRPFTTVNDVLRQVPRYIKPHMAETVIWKNDKNVMPYNGDFPLRGAITYNGGDGNIHPKGKRPFNNQELAQLQGFPSTHKFVGTKTSIMKQIGNAVPSKAATPFFEEIMRSLKKFDREVAAHKDEVIEID